MAEEKKEEKAEAQAAQKEAVPAQPAVEPKTEPKAETVPPEGPAPAADLPAKAKDEKAEAAPAPKKEMPANCAACNKSIKKKRWYYRSGKYYCTKRCWKSKLKKEEKPQEAADKT